MATVSVAFGAAYVAVAALVILPLGTIAVNESYSVLVNALAVCIVGGLGSTMGVIVASFLIGYAQTITATYLETSWMMIVSLLAILVILLVQPLGALRQPKATERAHLMSSTAMSASRRRERLDRDIKVRSEDIYALNSWREALYALAPRALPVLCLRGIYFAIVTLILPLMIERIIEATKVFGVTERLSGLTPFPHPMVESFITMGALWVALFGLRRIMVSDYGLVLKGINDNDRAVMSAALNIYRYKAQALFLASAAVGGPALGAFILVPMSEMLRGIGGLRIVIYAVFLFIFTVGLPEGVFHYLRRKYTQFERWTEVGK